MKLSQEDKQINLDRMRYIKNKLPANFSLLAIVFDVLFFVVIYKINNPFYYRILIGASIVYNLIFMLAAFLSSEEIKNYKKVFGYVMIVLGIIQIARIFIIPMKALKAEAMTSTQFLLCLIFVLASAALLISGGIVGIIRSMVLQNYVESIGEEARRD